MPKIPLAKKTSSTTFGAMIVATCIQSYYQFPGVATIGTAFGGIPQGLPSLTLPEISISDVFAFDWPSFHYCYARCY